MLDNKLLGLNEGDLEVLSDKSRNMSGAEIEGLVKSAASYALFGNMDIKDLRVDQELSKKLARHSVSVQMHHFEKALEEVKPAFGVAEDDFATFLRGNIYNVGSEFERVMTTVRTALDQLKSSASTQVISVLIEGPPGSGKSALASRLSVETNFPFIKLINPEKFVGLGEVEKCNIMDKIFTDSYKSPLSMIMLDNLERLLEYVAVGPRFSNIVLQTLMVLLQRLPQNKERKLFMIATSSSLPLMKSLGLRNCFTYVLRTPMITKPEHVLNVIKSMGISVVETDKAKVLIWLTN